MSFHATAAAFSARQNFLATFRTHLKSSVVTALILAATATGAMADGKYFMAPTKPGGISEKTDDLEQAAKSWRDDAEFKGSWAARAMRAEYAYALGLYGTGIRVGVLDSGVDVTHPELENSRIHGVKTVGTYYGDTFQFYSDKDKGPVPVKKGDAFDVAGTYIEGINDEHGTMVSGAIGAARNGLDKGGYGMQGLAFEAEIYSANTNGTDDNRQQGSDSLDYNYFMAGYDALAKEKVRIVNNSWGQNSPNDKENNVDTLPDLINAYSGFSKHTLTGNKTWLDAAAESAIKHDIVQVVSASNDDMDNPDIFASLPYFRPQLEGHWIAVTGYFDNNWRIGQAQVFNRCGVAKYWCIMGPTVTDSTTKGGRYTTFKGTSASAPYVSAALALVMQKYPYMTSEQALTVLFTTAQNKITEPSPDSSKEMLADELIGPSTLAMDGESKIPNKFAGWGLPDLNKAMNGPGQFLGRFEAKLGAGVSDTWSNDISDEAWQQRKIEDDDEHTAWKELKKTKGWEDGLPANASDADKTEFAYMTARDEAYLARQYNGGLTKLGEGQLTLSGTNTYSGDTIIDGGKLVIAEAGSITSSAFVNTGGWFAVEGLAAAVTVNEAGLLSVAETGTAGDVTLNGGHASVEGKSGGVTVNGIVAGDGSVKSWGMLSGSGSLGSLAANSGGIISPRISFGKLTVTGDATFNRGSIFDVEIMAEKSAAGQLDVKGKVTLLGGVVQTSIEGETAFFTAGQVNDLFGRSYDILLAGGGFSGNGRFENTQPYKYLTVQLEYSANMVSLRFVEKKEEQIAADPKVPPVTQEPAVTSTPQVPVTQETTIDPVIRQTPHIHVGSDAGTLNQKAVAGAIDHMEAGDPLYNTVLFSKIDEIQNYDGLSGEVHATLSGVLIEDSHFISQAATDRIRAAFDGVALKAQPTTSPLAYASNSSTELKPAAGGEAFAALEPKASTIALWGEAYGAWAHATSDGNAAGYKSNTGGFVTGFDGVVADTWRLGLLAGYGNSSLNGGGAKAEVDSYQAGIYAGTQWDALGLRLGINLTQHEIETKRTANFGALSNDHDASYDARTVQLFGELGYEIKTAYADFEPFAGASHVHLKTDGFSEDGAISNLTGQSSTSDVTMTTLGLRAARDFAFSQTLTLTTRAMLGWNHAFGDATPQAGLAFAGGQAFTTQGLPIAADAAVVEAGFDLGVGRYTSIGLSYTGQFSKQAQDNAVKADLTVRF